jgi:ABC-type transport system substrate-binding protein
MTDANAIPTIQRGGVDLALGGIPDPMAHSYFLESLLLYSKSPYSLYKDPAFDKELEGMVATLDPIEREKKARQLNDMIYDQALGLFTYQRIKTYGVSRDVQFIPSITGMSYFADVEMGGSRK